MTTTVTRIAIGAALLGAAAIGAIVTNFGNAQPEKSLSAADAEAVRAIVRDYIRENPQEIIEALDAFAAQERVRAVANTKSAARDALPLLLSDAGGYSVGADKAAASVAVIEFFDYHCGFCKRGSGFVQELTKTDPAVKVVFIELPILREESDLAARYALAARDQGKYAEVHFAFMNASGVLTKDRIRTIAKDAGVDVTAADRREGEPAVAAIIDANRQMAETLGVDGTPSFIVASLDGEFLEVIPGLSEENVTAAIAAAKKSAGKPKAPVAAQP